MKAVDGWNRITWLTWWIYEVGVFFGKHGGKSVIDIARELDALVVGDKVSTNFPMVNCAAAFNAYQSMVGGIDNKTMFMEYRVGVHV
jgi:uncharacterized membrane protein